MTDQPEQRSRPASRPALSPSRAADFKQCPLLYRFRAIDRLPEAQVFFREAHKLDADRHAAFRADRRRYHEGFRQVIATGQAAGEFATTVPPDTVVQIAMGVVNQLPVWYRQDGSKTAEELGNEIADFVLAALRP